MRRKLEESEERLEESRARLEKSAAKLEELAELRGDLKESRARVEELTARLELQDGSHEETRGNLDARLADLGVAEAAVDAMRLEFASEKEARLLETAELRGDLKESQARVQELTARLELQDDSQAEIATESEARLVELIELRGELKASRAHIERLEAQLELQDGSHEELRANLDARLADLSNAEAAVDAMRLEMDAALDDASAASVEIRARLEEEHAARVAELETNMRRLEETMTHQAGLSKAEAEAMLRHRRTMGRAAGRGAVEMPVQFEIHGIAAVPQGMRVAVVGTWNGWDLTSAIPMNKIQGGEGGDETWAAAQRIRSDDTYEYKYVLIREGGGEAHSLEELERDAVWQNGNNRTLALQFSLHRHVVLVEVEDTWNPNPKDSPILLHHLDGSIEETGSTQLLRDCIRELRTEQALLDGGGASLIEADIMEPEVVDLHDLEEQLQDGRVVFSTDGVVDLGGAAPGNVPMMMETEMMTEEDMLLQMAKVGERESRPFVRFFLLGDRSTDKTDHCFFCFFVVFFWFRKRDSIFTSDGQGAQKRSG